jgi:ABC-type sugar transport system substrate-binding protein
MLVHRLKPSSGRAYGRTRGFRAFLVLAIGMAGVSPGCDSMSFVPPRPAELSAGAASGPNTSVGTSAVASAPASTRAGEGTKAARSPSLPRARIVELILSQPPSVDRLFMEQFLRRDAGTKKCAFRSVKPETGEPMTAAQLAQAIRKAADHATGALILEAIDAPEVQAAISDAESKGTSIVLLDAPLPSPSPGKIRPYVEFKAFTEAGKEIVQTAIEEARLFHLPADGSVLVIQNSQQDKLGPRRFESLASALKAAGRHYEVIVFNGDQQAGLELILKYLTDHPQTTILLAEEDYGLTAGFQARRKVLSESDRHLIVGGYGANDIRLDMSVKNGISALADRNIEGYTRKALQVALDQMDGKSAPERIEVALPFTRNQPDHYPAKAESKKTGQKDRAPESVEKLGPTAAPAKK